MGVLELKVEGRSEFLEGIKVKTPMLLRKMAYNMVGNVAAEGRKKEQKTANYLDMEQIQTNKKGTYVRSVWDAKLGYVSTTRQTKKGPFRMASFAWERVQKQGQASSDYSNQIANLWHRPSRAYRSRSPIVGQPGRYMRWEVGERRPVKYSWSKVYSVLEAEIPGAIRRADDKFSREWRKI